ncbi:MAG TPA: hypothetical protein VGO93_30305 [Candidatus Xenobia bacterium]|jgi:hypothetical protein
MARRAHVYQHGEDAIDQIQVLAAYVLPSDRAESPGWQAAIETLLLAIQAFHHREFHSLSKVSYSLHPRAIPARDTRWYRQFNENGQFFWKMLELMPAPSGSGFHSALVFADWGMRDNDGLGGDTYLRKRRRQDIDVSDIQHIHGCRGVYLGRGRGAGFISEEDSPL